MKKLIPTIYLCEKDLPQWIISSNIAAYHPESSTIYLRKNRKMKLFLDFCHELIHHFIHLLNLSEKYHYKFDYLNTRIFGEISENIQNS